ncbi:MAG: hypothetical protein GX142_01175 [Chloroflexi bacterium]|nr:hypothetical protein [Chloroflexota bacterium]
MQNRSALPDLERLSIVTATIMLAFALTQLITFSAQKVSFSMFGLFLDFEINFNTLVIVFAVFLAAAGMDWLIQSNPDKQDKAHRWATTRHWIVPVLTALVIGVALSSFVGSVLWWVVYFLGSLLLFAVFIGEYNVFIAEDTVNPLATIGLTALSFVLFLLLAIAVFSANIRLYVRLPLLGIGALMVTSRTLFLRLGAWHTLWGLVVSLITSELVVGLHYLPLNPIKDGLLLVGMVYALTSIVTAIKEARSSWAFWSEPIAMLLLTILLSIVWA